LYIDHQAVSHIESNKHTKHTPSTFRYTIDPYRTMKLSVSLLAVAALSMSMDFRTVQAFAPSTRANMARAAYNTRPLSAQSTPIDASPPTAQSTPIDADPSEYNNDTPQPPTRDILDLDETKDINEPDISKPMSKLDSKQTPRPSTEPARRAAIVDMLKRDLLQLSRTADRGMDASSSQVARARQIIKELARYNPTKEPARPYYEYSSNQPTNPSKNTIAGKWTLVWTDAPDITSLKQNRLAQLGRIGQECSPPFIKNVIEWKPPAWARNLPRSQRILQKVVTEATANPREPFRVNLQVAGLEVKTEAKSTGSYLRDVQREGLLVANLQRNPIQLQGNVRLPFGQFEILYLDDEMRIIQTGQGYMAVNMRTPGEEWF
jgi:PAP_fibrillin